MKRLYITALLVLTSAVAIAQTSVWNGSKELWTRGAGTENDPYLIESAENLAFLAYAVNKGYDTKGIYFKLTTNIDLNGSEDQPWVPIGLDWFYSEDGCQRTYPTYGNWGYPNFSGQFDGDSHFISNIYVDATIGGLFGYVSGTRDEPAEIRNVFLINGHIKGGRAGGIVGRADYCNIIRCCNGADIEGQDVGGIAGRGGSIYNCFNKGRLTGSSNVGGIVGYEPKEIKECYNKGEVEVHGQFGGGLFGSVSNTNCIIMNCYNTASIFGSASGISLGGGIGGIGGIIANKTSIKNCYNVGNVSNTMQIVGGLFGGYLGSPLVENCYYLNTCGGGDEGLAAEEMRSPSFVDTLNFETDVWGFDATNINDGYPILINNYYPIQYNLVVLSSDETLGHARIIQLPDWTNNVATVVAEPIGDHPFLNWTSNGQVVSTANPYTFVVEEDIELVANFYGTGVDEETEQKVTISPNPTKDFVSIECESMKDIAICSLDGRVVKTYSELKTNAFTLDMIGLSKGIYILRIDTQEGSIINKKIIKE